LLVIFYSAVSSSSISDRYNGVCRYS